MCIFFNFISDGKGNVKYFNVEQRKQFFKNNPEQYIMDLHSSIATYYYGSNISDDNYNKYEYNKNGFIIKQINTEDDSKQVEKWINKFIETDEYKNLCEIFVEQNKWALQYVPEKHITKKLCKMAVEQNGSMLQYVPEKYMNKELCKMAIEQNGNSLKYVPEHLIDYYLSKKAIEQDGNALRYVPDNFKKDLTSF